MASSMRFISRILGRVPSSPISRPVTTSATQRILPLRPSKSTCQTQTFNGLSKRGFATSTPLRNKPNPMGKPMGKVKTQNFTGISWNATMLFILTAAGLMVYFRVEKERLQRKQIREMSKGVGKPKVGGPFVLRDLDGNEVTEEELKGKYAFVYFGFTHCPDICPDELDKMAAIIDRVSAEAKNDKVFQPVFITCDPARDTPEVLRAYLKEFHPGILGLTGTYDQVKHVCKQYRVYFSTPKDIKPGEDYLVDHSIYFYLMDPDGDFVECIGRQDTPESATKVIMDHINDWKREGKPLKNY